MLKVLRVAAAPRLYFLQLLMLHLHQARRVLFPSRPAVRYDVLSIDTGITPAADSVPGAAKHTTAVKPIDK